MKRLLCLTLLFALSANAETVITGGYGTDGATGESIPKDFSIMDAVHAYQLLNIAPDAQGRKSITLEDESSFQCDKPYKGVFRINMALPHGRRSLMRIAANITCSKSARYVKCIIQDTNAMDFDLDLP